MKIIKIGKIDNIPDWVIEKITKYYKTTKRDVVYNIYNCGCFLLHSEDLKRKKRFREKIVQGKRIRKMFCDCEFCSHFLCKMKICSVCGNVNIGNKLFDGVCGKCKDMCSFETKTKKSFYYQNGKLFEQKPKYSNYTNPDCIHRNECLKEIVNLPDTLNDTYLVVFLWCYGCPESKNIDRNIYDKQSNASSETMHS